MGPLSHLRVTQSFPCPPPVPIGVSGGVMHFQSLWMTITQVHPFPHLSQICHPARLRPTSGGVHPLVVSIWWRWGRGGVFWEHRCVGHLLS